MLIGNFSPFDNPPAASLEDPLVFNLLHQSDCGIQALRQTGILGERNVLNAWTANQGYRLNNQMREITGRQWLQGRSGLKADHSCPAVWPDGFLG